MSYELKKHKQIIIQRLKQYDIVAGAVLKMAKLLFIGRNKDQLPTIIWQFKDIQSIEFLINENKLDHLGNTLVQTYGVCFELHMVTKIDNLPENCQNLVNEYTKKYSGI